MNALAIGAADTSCAKWKRAEYSCVGPGRSPGYVKPDGVAFGGSDSEPFKVFNPLLGSAVGVQGTSYSAPLTLRTAAGVACSTSYEMTAIALKALLVHHAEYKRKISRNEIGWGRFQENALTPSRVRGRQRHHHLPGAVGEGTVSPLPNSLPRYSHHRQGEDQSYLLHPSAHRPGAHHQLHTRRNGRGVSPRPVQASKQAKTSLAAALSTR